MSKRVSRLLVSIVVAATALNAYAVDPLYVIHISVDGGGASYIQNQIDLGNLPNFLRFQTEGAFTNNARTDYDYTITLPNHTSMLTGRGVVGVTGHNWTSNTDPAVGQTLATNKGSYVASILDVVHDNGLRTAMYAGKTKFSLYDTSYNATNGAADITGPNNGNDKLDTYYYNSNSTTLTNQFITDMTANPFNFTFIHFADPDNAGHASGWGGATYNTALQTIDARLGQIFTLVTTNPTFIGKTAIVLTADHGGTGTDHSNNSLAIDYTIPFYVWGAGVEQGVDLYALNSTTRVDPLTGRPTYAASGQPIRSGDSANLELDLLGLGPVPGSTINFSQNLAVTSLPEPASLGVLVAGSAVLLIRRRKQ